MSGFPFGIVVEGSVAILLVVTIGYCVVLNARLKRLHGDRDTLRQMVTDLVQATRLANAAIKELKSTAVEADLTLTTRLEEAEKFGIELASHINAGHAVLGRIAKVIKAARTSPELAEAEANAVEQDNQTGEQQEQSRVATALAQLASLERMRGSAA